MSLGLTGASRACSKSPASMRNTPSSSSRVTFLKFHAPFTVSSASSTVRLPAFAIATRCCARTSRHFSGGRTLSMRPSSAPRAASAAANESAPVFGYIKRLLTLPGP